MGMEGDYRWDQRVNAVDKPMGLRRVETHETRPDPDSERVEGRICLVASTEAGSFPVTLRLMADGTVKWHAPFATWCADGSKIGASASGELDD
jgi:hypothetical protein